MCFVSNSKSIFSDISLLFNFLNNVDSVIQYQFDFFFQVSSDDDMNSRDATSPGYFVSKITNAL